MVWEVCLYAKGDIRSPESHRLAATSNRTRLLRSLRVYRLELEVTPFRPFPRRLLLWETCSTVLSPACGTAWSCPLFKWWMLLILHPAQDHQVPSPGFEPGPTIKSFEDSCFTSLHMGAYFLYLFLSLIFFLSCNSKSENLLLFLPANVFV